MNPPFIPLAEYIPETFMPEHKRLVPEIFKQWQLLKGSKPETCKQRYIQLARSLKTYGILTLL
jgi:hypothetical protein